MSDNMVSLADCANDANADHGVAVFKGQLIHQRQFAFEVSALCTDLQRHHSDRFALYFEEGYPFAVSFFAALNAGKKVLIAANNTEFTTQSLLNQGYPLLGDWHGQQQVFNPQATESVLLTPLDLKLQAIDLYTSGSDGQPKRIEKKLIQLQTEIETLESLWSQQLGEAVIAATVSHQHIYGLLFKILWPLVSQRIFYSASFLSPEPLLKAINGQPAVWVASPAQLKRLDALSPWESIKKLNLIFSSGGLLSESSAKNLSDNGQKNVIEVYGSTETGGIAWRQPLQNPLWTPFPGMHLSRSADSEFFLQSPYLPNHQSILLDDQLALHPNGQFELLGRKDRIIKLEEKRLSLTELETTIQQSPWIDQAFAKRIQREAERDLLSVTLVLSEQGRNQLYALQRKTFLQQLKERLLIRFEPVVLPRKWVFVDQIPVTSQGKVDQQRLQTLYALPTTHFPLLYGFKHDPDSLELELYIQAKLVYFKGHFPEQAILPGVAQIHLVDKYAQVFLNMARTFHSIELIKFSKIITPQKHLFLALNWKADSGKLYFKFYCHQNIYSSGRLVYR